ncbi:hypothetical protein M3Y98_01144500 [Aphelenchoides besseyi]|nr:hypothetical protein M3Y98_01144500 [Aphelenchoides besseyi]
MKTDYYAELYKKEDQGTTYHCPWCAVEWTTCILKLSHHVARTWLRNHLLSCQFVEQAKIRFLRDTAPRAIASSFVHPQHYENTKITRRVRSRNCFYAFVAHNPEFYNYASFVQNYNYFGVAHSTCGIPDPFGKKMENHTNHGKLDRSNYATIPLLFSESFKYVAQAEAVAILLLKNEPHISNCSNELLVLTDMSRERFLLIADSVKTSIRWHFTYVHNRTSADFMSECHFFEFQRKFAELRRLAAGLESYNM